MKFNLSRSVYFAFRRAIIAALAGSVFGAIVMVVSWQKDGLIIWAIAFFNLTFFLSIAWDVFTKEAPDA